VGYPIIDLRRGAQDLHRYLRWLEEVLIELLSSYSITATTRPALTGVWVEDRKIASIGVGVRQWITMHGFALNVGADLSAFDQIVPCGISRVVMTSIERESGQSCAVEEVSRRAAEVFGKARDRLFCGAEGEETARPRGRFSTKKDSGSAR
jgi:lipoate-protein ligase B